MNGMTILVVLQGKNTRTTNSVRVVFDCRCSSYSSNCFTRNDSILFKFIKAVIGHAIVAAEYQDLHTA